MIRFQKPTLYLIRILERTKLTFRNVVAIYLLQNLHRMDTEKQQKKQDSNKQTVGKTWEKHHAHSSHNSISGFAAASCFSAVSEWQNSTMQSRSRSQWFLWGLTRARFNAQSVEKMASALLLQCNNCLLSVHDISRTYLSKIWMKPTQPICRSSQFTVLLSMGRELVLV